MRYIYNGDNGETAGTGAHADRPPADVLKPVGILYAQVTHGERADGNEEAQAELARHKLARLRPQHVDDLVGRHAFHNTMDDRLPTILQSGLVGSARGRVSTQLSMFHPTDARTRNTKSQRAKGDENYNTLLIVNIAELIESGQHVLVTVNGLITVPGDIHMRFIEEVWIFPGGVHQNPDVAYLVYNRQLNSFNPVATEPPTNQATLAVHDNGRRWQLGLSGHARQNWFQNVVPMHTLQNHEDWNRVAQQSNARLFMCDGCNKLSPVGVTSCSACWRSVIYEHEDFPNVYFSPASSIASSDDSATARLTAEQYQAMIDDTLRKRLTHENDTDTSTQVVRAAEMIGPDNQFTIVPPLYSWENFRTYVPMASVFLERMISFITRKLIAGTAEFPSITYNQVAQDIDVMLARAPWSNTPGECTDTKGWIQAFKSLMDDNDMTRTSVDDLDWSTSLVDMSDVKVYHTDVRTDGRNAVFTAQSQHYVGRHNQDTDSVPYNPFADSLGARLQLWAAMKNTFPRGMKDGPQREKMQRQREAEIITLCAKPAPAPKTFMARFAMKFIYDLINTPEKRRELKRKDTWFAGLKWFPGFEDNNEEDTLHWFITEAVRAERERLGDEVHNHPLPADDWTMWVLTTLSKEGNLSLDYFETQERLHKAQKDRDLPSELGRRRTHVTHNPMAVTAMIAASAIQIADAAGDSSAETVTGWTKVIQSACDSFGTWRTIANIFAIILFIMAYLKICYQNRRAGQWIQFKMDLQWFQRHWKSETEKMIFHQPMPTRLVSLTSVAATTVTTTGVTLIIIVSTIITLTYKVQSQQRELNYIEDQVDKYIAKVEGDVDWHPLWDQVCMGRCDVCGVTGQLRTPCPKAACREEGGHYGEGNELLEARNDILARVRRYDAIMERVYKECNAADERLRRNMAMQVLHPSTAHPKQDHTFIKHWRGDKASLFNEKMKIWLDDADAMMSSRQKVVRAQDEKLRQLRNRLYAISRTYDEMEDEAVAKATDGDGTNITEETKIQLVTRQMGINLDKAVSRHERSVLC